ncbi:MAG: LysM peptidoglycan-binding domain-containing protein [Ilumatobacter sp.]|uniref:LysM peptidoglycan-binding domain-containing protein n=1 Tax=Ilumatobacter sp. TaxID=1967498 RepID=UPI00391D4A37
MTAASIRHASTTSDVDSSRRRPNGVRSAGVVSLAAAIGLAACGTTDEASRETLPPLVTTTTTTVPEDEDPNAGKVRFYEIQPGESLAMIARAFEVPTQSIIDLNNIENPDNVPAGLIIQIPTDIVLVSELPTPGETTTVP